MSRSVRLSIAALVWVAVLSGCAGGALSGTAVQGTTGAEAGVPASTSSSRVVAPQYIPPSSARTTRTTTATTTPSPESSPKPTPRPEARPSPTPRPKPTPKPAPRPAPTPTPAAGQLVPPAGGPTAGSPSCPGVACVSIAVTGDILLHPELVEQARQDGNGELDFFPLLAAQQPYIQGADIGICHLETPLAPPDGPFSGYPSFSVPPQVLDAVKRTGYDACSTASNHTFDRGTDGLDRTLDQLDAAGIPHDGSYRTERDSQTPVVINTANGRVGLISVAYDWNGLTLDEPWQANLIDTADIIARAKKARAAGADLVVVAMHAGEEYETMPNLQQKNAAKALLADPNIDLVYGHHAHVVQPMEKINGKWAVYGLGNTIAAQGSRNVGTRDGLLVRVQFSKSADGRWTTSDVAWLPSLQDVESPYRWCPLTAGSGCASPEEDAASLERTTSAVTMWGADADGARRM
ncbi:CapA family protein [Nakamurella sp. GG22]